MPLIHYVCSCTYSVSKFYRRPKQAPISLTCTKCGLTSKKTLKGPNSASIISIDNGVQARATQVNLEVIEDIQARSTKDFSEK